MHGLTLLWWLACCALARACCDGWLAVLWLVTDDAQLVMPWVGCRAQHCFPGTRLWGRAGCHTCPLSQAAVKQLLPTSWLTLCRPLPLPPLQVIAGRPNVCKQLHMPAQSGSSAMLDKMRRG